MIPNYYIDQVKDTSQPDLVTMNAILLMMLEELKGIKENIADIDTELENVRDVIKFK